MSYQRLVEDTIEIDRLAIALTELVTDSKPNCSTASDLLWDLSAAVNDHFAYEDRTVYAGANRRGVKIGQLGSSIAPTEFRTNWQNYLLDWQADTIECDWSAFAAETFVMLNRLRKHLDDEVSLVYPTALQHGLIKLRMSCADRQPILGNREPQASYA